MKLLFTNTTISQYRTNSKCY